MPLHLHYLLDESLPNQTAAAVQILKTGSALCAAGHRFTVHHRGAIASRSALLAYYGLPDDPALSFSRLFPGAAPSLPRRVVFGMRLRALARRGHGAFSPVLMARGVTGLQYLPDVMAHRRATAPPVIYEIHNIQFLRQAEKLAQHSLDAAEIRDPASESLRQREARVISGADGLVGISKALLDDLTVIDADLPPSLVLPSGTDTCAPLPDQRPCRFDIVYVGKIEPRKGIFTLVDAMAHLPGRTLGIAGGSEDDRDALMHRATQLGVADRITLAGFVPPGQVAAFLASGRIGVCPLSTHVDTVSDRHTSPMKLLQMMGVGLPVVASDTAPVRVVTGPDGAHLVAPNDPVALARAMSDLLDDAPRRACLSAASRAIAARYAWPVRAEALARFLSQRVAMGAGRAFRANGTSAAR